MKKLSTLLTCIVASMTLQSHANDTSTLFGCLTYTTQTDTPTGMYTFQSDANAKKLLKADIKANSGGVCIDDSYYAISSTLVGGYYEDTYVVKLIEYDVNSWEKISETASVKTSMSQDLTYDPTTGKIYGSFYTIGDKGYTIGTLDLTTGRSTPLGGEVSASGYRGIMAGNDGSLYGITAMGDLVTIDKTNGKIVTTVGPTGVRPGSTGSACIDPASGRCIWFILTDAAVPALYQIDLTNGTAQLLYEYSYNERLAGLYIPAEVAGDDAPANPQDVKPTFSNGSLQGNVSFKVPGVTKGGNEGKGDVSFTVTANGKEVAMGVTSFGADKTCDVTVDAAGEYEFAVRLSNDAGKSSAVKSTLWVGNDIPVKPTGVNLANDGTSIQLTWNPVSSGVHSGYIDPSKIYYVITRYPDETVVADKFTDTLFEEDIEMPEKLTQVYYTVSASLAGVESEAAKSNNIAIGTIVPPYTADLSDKTLPGFTVIDGNNDGTKWGAIGGQVRIDDNSKLDKDDWLLLPAIKLQASTSYLFQMDVYGNSKPECFEVKAGSAPTSETMTIDVIQAQEYTGWAKKTFSGTLSVPQDGIYYVGIHATTPKGHGALKVNKISVTLNGSSAIDSLPVTPGEGNAEYYDTRGIRVHTPENGIYIQRQGNCVSKIIVK